MPHTVHGCPASLLHWANDRQMCYQFLQFLTLGAYPGSKFIKGEMTYYPPRSTIVQNFSPIVQMIYEICITKVFSTFWPRGLTHGPKFTKGELTWQTPSSTILQNFIALCQPTPEISVTKNPVDRQKKKQTVTVISPRCLSVCGDKKHQVSHGSSYKKLALSSFLNDCSDWALVEGV